MASQNLPPFRYPTQSLADLELIEEIPLGRGESSHPALETAYGSPHPKSPEHQLVWQELLAGKEGTLSVRRLYRKLPGEVIEGRVVRDATWGVGAEVETQEVAAGTPPDEGFEVLESVVEGKDAQVARKKTTRVDWPTLISQRLNARGDLETTTESRVETDEALPEATLLTTGLQLDAETKYRARLKVSEVVEHSELEERTLGDAGLIPARLRAQEVHTLSESIVAPDTLPDALADGVMSSKVTGKTRSQSVKRTLLRSEASFPSVTDYKLGNEGEVLEVTEGVVAPGTLPEGGFRVLEASVRDTGIGVAIHSKTELASGESYPTLEGKLTENETRVPITVTREMVSAGSSIDLTDPLIIEHKVQAIDKWRSLSITTRLDSIPDSYLEYRHINFNFPGLFYDYESVAGGTVFYRHSFTRIVPMQVEISFSTAPVAVSIFEIRSAGWSYPLGLHVANVLTNGETFTYTAQGTPLTMTVPTTVPTRAAYEALIGTWVAIGGNSVRWKGGLWRSEVWKVKLL